MTNTLQGFINEVIDVIQTELSLTAGLAGAILNKWPAVPIWAATGYANAELGSQASYHHEVRIGILGPNDQPDRIGPILTSKLEPIIEKMMSKLLAHSFVNVECFGLISYTYGPIDWGGELRFGFILTVHDVVIRNTIT